MTEIKEFKVGQIVIDLVGNVGTISEVAGRLYWVKMNRHRSDESPYLKTELTLAMIIKSRWN